MLGIIRQNLRPPDRFQHFIKADRLFHHLLLSALGYPKVFDCRLGLDALEYLLKLGCIPLLIPASKYHACPAYGKQAVTRGNRKVKTFGLRIFIPDFRFERGF